MWIKERQAVRETVPDVRCDVTPDEGRLRRWVEQLAVPRHIFANPRNNASVRDMLAGAFQRQGLSVQVQGPYRNVVALPQGASGQPVSVIAAHYDSVPDCPGADDNASGLAVMLECARVLAQSDSRPPVAFIAFNAEEDGLLGSRDFVSNGLPGLPFPLGSVHVLEMVGFTGGSSAPQNLPLPWVPASLQIPDFIGFIAKGSSNAVVDCVASSAAAPELRLVAAKTWGPLHRLLPDLTRSDHFPFWNAGKSAVLWTDTGNFRNPNYHRATDTPDTLDYSFMRQVADLLCFAVSTPASK
jgi:hypothetical protein